MEEADKIRGYIESSIGYTKLDKQVLSGIASGCLDQVLPVMKAEKRQDEAASMLYGLAEMLLEAEVSKGVWARACVRIL